MPFAPSTTPSTVFLASLCLSLCLSLFYAPSAHAQSITVAQETSLARFDANGQQVAKRPLFLNPEAINAQDCRDNQSIRLPVELTGFQPNAAVQIWASTGADCAIPMNRAGDAARCWNVVPAVPLQASVEVFVPVRTLLSRTADDTACGSVDLTTIDLQILMFTNAPTAEEPAIVSKHLSIVADTVGPEPPTASVFPGNGRARVEVRSTGSHTITSITAVNAYCEKSASPDRCSAPSLLPRESPDPARECGSIAGSTGSVFFTGPLANGENHAVAVAARDAFGNVGPLSTITCTVPSPDAETKVQSLDEPTGCTTSKPSLASRNGVPFALDALALVFALAVVRARARARESSRTH